MVRLRHVSFLLFCSSLAAVACEQVKSANPTSPDVAGPIPGVAISAPRPLEPGQGAQVVKNGEPLTLTAENASSSGQRTLYMQFELASDVNFTQLVHHADRVEPGANGRTTYRLPEPLGAGFTYYWRARAMDGANNGPFSFTSAFSVIDPVVIETPMPLEPAGDLPTNRPQFRVRNGAMSGTHGVYYRFELASAPDPSAIVAVVTVTPGSNGETSMSLGDLPWDRTFYWRVHASDGTNQSGFAGPIAFKTPRAPAPPPPPPPAPVPLPGGGPSPAPVPGGGGGRTPDPPPGQRLPLPNMLHVVQQVANARPDLLARSCQEHGGTWEFLNLVVDTCARMTRAGATTANAATPAIRQWTSSTTTTAPAPVTARARCTSSTFWADTVDPTRRRAGTTSRSSGRASGFR